MAEISKWKEFERQFKRSFKSGFKLYWSSMYGKVGLIIIAMFAFMAIFAPWLTPYTPDFEAPTLDALSTTLYAFDTEDPIYGMTIGYTHLYEVSSGGGGDWIILNHGKYISGVFVRNPKTSTGTPTNPETPEEAPQTNQSQNQTAPWEVYPLDFRLDLSDIPQISNSEFVRDIVYLSPAATDVNYHYNGVNQRIDWAGELVFITQKHLVIYDMYNFLNETHQRYSVVNLSFEPTWVVADMVSTGDYMKPLVFNTTSNFFVQPKYPNRYIMVGNERSFVLFFHYYTYSGEPTQPPIKDCLTEIYPSFNPSVTDVTDRYELPGKITFKPRIFYARELELRGENVIVIPLEDRTAVMTRFDKYQTMPYYSPGVVPIIYSETSTSQINLTYIPYSLTAAPGYYIQAQDEGINPILLPTSEDGKALIYTLSVRNDIPAIREDITIDMGSGAPTAQPQLFKAGDYFNIYAVRYDGTSSYMYQYKGSFSDGFTASPFVNPNGTSIDYIEVKGEKVIKALYVQENSQVFLLTENGHLYLFDIHEYQSSGFSKVITFSYVHWKTHKRGEIPYPQGGILSDFIFVGSLRGTKYTPSSAAYDIFAAYYCNNTKTVGLHLLKGESILPLPPGKYPSGNRYILGTDDKGHDIWTWLVYGSRVAFVVGILASFFSVMIGTLYGVYSGYKGGKTDTIMMRFVDIMLTLPGLPVLLILTSILGPSIWNIILVIAVLGWSGIARVIRAQTLSLKNRPFVDAARVAGASNARIMIFHIFPNVVPFSFLYMTLGVAGAIISEASLSFLGLGDPKAISWGQMLYSIQTAGATMYAWWWLLPPGLAITLISLGFYLVGRAFDEILNPRLRKR